MLFDWFDLFNEVEDRRPKVPVQEIADLLGKISDQLSSLVAQQVTQGGHGPLHLGVKPYPAFGDLEDEQLGPKGESQLQGQDITTVLESSRQALSRFLPAPKEPMRASLKERRETLTNRQREQTNVIYLGHQNWNLILNMMIGVRKATKAIYPTLGELSPDEFERKCAYELIHQTTELGPEEASMFYDYAPAVFHEIRGLSGYSAYDYLRSMGPENLIGNFVLGNLSSISEHMSYGKSGSFFYYTEDTRLLIKTISKVEFHLMRRILPRYYHHLKANPDSLVTRVFGLYKMKVEGFKLYILSMKNLFSLPFELHLRYDIKGSTHGRTSRDKPWDKTIALKDLDLLED